MSHHIDCTDVLKSLRVALDYQVEEIARLIEIGGGSRPSTARVRAWLAGRDNRRHQPMHDHELRSLLQGIVQVERDGVEMGDEDE